VTTSQSPLRVLKAQADIVARSMKAAERGEIVVGYDPDARKRDSVKVCVVMDDKVLTIEMTWAQIKATSEAGISEYVLRQMRGARDKAN
jgi:hypothetical protein